MYSASFFATEAYSIISHKKSMALTLFWHTFSRIVGSNFVARAFECLAIYCTAALFANSTLTENGEERWREQGAGGPMSCSAVSCWQK